MRDNAMMLLRRTAVLGALAAAFAGCGATESNVLRIGTNFFPSGVNPFSQSVYPSPFTYTYPHLVLYDTPKSKFAGSYAASWSRSADGRTWTFRLQPGWKWSDGREVTASDAAWSVNTAVKFQKGPTAAIAGYVTGIARAEAPDKTTLVLRLSKPVTSSLFLSNLVLLSVVPEHVWSKYATGDGQKLKSFSNVPTSDRPFVAGGPFTITKFKTNSTLTYARNPEWVGPKPHIDGFGEQYFSDTSALAAALQKGSIDYATKGVGENQVKPLKSHGVEVHPSGGLNGTYLAVNAYHSRTHPELGNPKVREAFDYAIDRNAIIKLAYNGHASPMSVPLVTPAMGNAPGTNLPWANPAIKVTPFDLARANQLLDEAGYTMGSNRVRTANGRQMSYTVILQTQLAGPGFRMFAIMQRDFAKIGVRLTVRPLDFGASLSALMEDNYSKYDLLFDSNGGVLDPEYMLNAFTCGQLGNQNDAGYCDKGYDRLYQQQAVAPSTEARVRIVWQMQKRFGESRSYIPIVARNTFNAWNKRYTGYVRGVNADYYWTSMKTMLGVRAAD